MGKLNEGRPEKFAKSNKLSLQCEDTNPENEWLKLLIYGATLLVLGKMRKL